MTITRHDNKLRVEHLTLGSSPLEEDCAQVGSTNYYERAQVECGQFIKAIRRKHGIEPDGAQMSIKGHAHDFGRYYEVEVMYDVDSKVAIDYAYRCEADLPMTWTEEDRAEMGLPHEPSQVDSWTVDDEYLKDEDEVEGKN